MSGPLGARRLVAAAPDAGAGSADPDRAAAPPDPHAWIAVIVKGWPRLSETFIAQELVGLEDRGHRLVVFSLRHPTDPAVHPLNRALRAPVTYLPEYLHDEPRRVVRAVRAARRRPGWAAALAAWRRDLARDRTRNRVRRFGQACVLAAELPAEVTHLYAHFLHTPASVARYAALLTGRPWSFSAHAKDIWTTPDWDARAKLAEAAWGVTCTRAGLAALRHLAAEPDRVSLLYHGLDRRRFPPPPAARPPRTGADPADPIRLVSVGRAVEKKGFDTLLEALADLPDHLHWRWTHIGNGPLLASLRHRAVALGLADRIAWRGAQAHDAVIEAYRTSDLFVLPARAARDGDRDGLPNVLMEALLLGLPCLATSAGAIPELIEHGVTGHLVAPADPAALAAAIAALAAAPDRRAAQAAAGRRRVETRFDAAPGLDALSARLAARADRAWAIGEDPAKTLAAIPT